MNTKLTQEQVVTYADIINGIETKELTGLFVKRMLYYMDESNTAGLLYDTTVRMIFREAIIDRLKVTVSYEKPRAFVVSYLKSSGMLTLLLFEVSEYALQHFGVNIVVENYTVSFHKSNTRHNIEKMIDNTYNSKDERDIMKYITTLVSTKTCHKFRQPNLARDMSHLNVKIG